MRRRIFIKDKETNKQEGLHEEENPRKEKRKGTLEEEESSKERREGALEELHDEPYEDFDPEDPSFFEDDDPEEEEPRPSRRWIKKWLAVLVVLGLFANIIAFFPQIFSLQAIDFLKKNRELSRNEAIQQYKQAVVVVNSGGRKGTGFNIAADGLIVTNHHVIEGERTSLVSFPEGKTFTADVVASDAAMDAALLRVRDPDPSLPTLEIAPVTDPMEGTPIYVIGNPLLFNQMANEGSILGLTSLTDWDVPVLMIQAPIYKGNSGSPILNKDGQVIAVVFATTQIKREGKSGKIGLAVPFSHFLKYIDEL
ncbi:S1C family serine protease [Paenibacillus sp. J2TS4]|uniref:S1C family serine protease n=1 Tax=Paenibacillus sp. J2TS4 TaxID=2807194 RepID=UPI001B17F1CF|nr:serine protease [Paenibacillus sp. J2TS4]GIP35103.1 hypothetical protein J2TS4_43130 [Paenibacillus sp. J2TS4]